MLAAVDGTFGMRPSMYRDIDRKASNFYAEGGKEHGYDD
jgi:hypothetical protein